MDKLKLTSSFAELVESVNKKAVLPESPKFTSLEIGYKTNIIYLDTTKNIDEFLAGLTYGTTDSYPYPFSHLVVLDNIYTTITAIKVSSYYALIAQDSQVTADSQQILYVSTNTPNAVLQQFGLTHAGWQNSYAKFNRPYTLTITTIKVETDFLSLTPCLYSSDYEKGLFLKALEDGTYEWAPVSGGGSSTGIESIEQTTTSTEDSGVNIITATLTDGTETTFEIRNGAKGATGKGILEIVESGPVTESDGYTISPIQIRYTDGTSATLNIKAKNGEGADTSKYAHLEGTNTFEGINVFTSITQFDGDAYASSGFNVGRYTDASTVEKTTYGLNYITLKKNSSTYNLTIPEKSGIIATIDTNNTWTGSNDFQSISATYLYMNDDNSYKEEGVFSTEYHDGYIEITDTDLEYHQLRFPPKSGTLATLDDVGSGGGGGSSLPHAPMGEPLVAGESIPDTIYYDTSKDIDEYLASLTYQEFQGIYIASIVTIVGKAFYEAGAMVAKMGDAYAVQVTSDNLLAGGNGLVYVSHNATEEVLTQLGATQTGWQVSSGSFVQSKAQSGDLVIEQVDAGATFISSTPLGYDDGLFLRLLGDGTMAWETPKADVVEIDITSYEDEVALSDSQLALLKKENTKLILNYTKTGGILIQKERSILSKALSVTMQSEDGSTLATNFNYATVVKNTAEDNTHYVISATYQLNGENAWVFKIARKPIYGNLLYRHFITAVIREGNVDAGTTVSTITFDFTSHEPYSAYDTLQAVLNGFLPAAGTSPVTGTMKITMSPTDITTNLFCSISRSTSDSYTADYYTGNGVMTMALTSTLIESATYSHTVTPLKA